MMSGSERREREQRPGRAPLRRRERPGQPASYPPPAGHRQAGCRTALGQSRSRRPDADGARRAPRAGEQAGRIRRSPQTVGEAPPEDSQGSGASPPGIGAGRRARPQAGLRVRGRQGQRAGLAARRDRASRLRRRASRRARQGGCLEQRAPVARRSVASAGHLSPSERRYVYCRPRRTARSLDRADGGPNADRSLIRRGESARRGRSAAKVAARARQLTP